MTAGFSARRAEPEAPEWPATGDTPVPVPRAGVALQSAAPPAISVILTIQNQRAALPQRYDELLAALANTSFEIIAIDDGSIDGSFAVLGELAASDRRLRAIRMRRRFGRSAALAAGFERARADVLVLVDAGMPIETSDIERLRRALDAGADLANGTRPAISAAERAGNWLISAATGVRLADYGSPLKACHASTARELRLYGDLHRFIPAIACWQGARISEVPLVARAAPNARQTFGIWRGFGLLLDMITMRFMLNYAHRPMQSIGRIGGLLLGAALALFAYLAVVKFGMGQNIGNRPLLLLAVLLGAVSVQVLVLGLLAELMIRVSYEVQHKPIYAIRETINAGEASADGHQRALTA